MTSAVNRKTVAIIGGGASGIIAAIHLLNRKMPEANIRLYETATELGRGYAYSQRNNSFLLNVRADNMGYDENLPNDFHLWLQDNDPGQMKAKNFPFVPRHLFGTYLQARLAEVKKKTVHNFEWVKEKVTQLHHKNGHWQLITELEQKTEVDFCVVATGYHTQHDRSILNCNCNFDSDRILNPAEISKYPKIMNSQKVAIIGTGLSAIDVWHALRSGGMQGEISLLSRRGQLPLSHAAVSKPYKLPELVGLNPAELLKKIRRLQTLENLTWPQIADCCRSQAAAVWSHWSHKQRTTFFVHLRPYWEQIRHRAPASILAELKNEILRGSTRIIRGRITATETTKDKLHIHLKNGTQLSSDWIVLATGVPIQLELKSASLKPNSLRIGYEWNDERDLFILGPAAKAQSWETTAIPEIRRHSAEIAGKISFLLTTGRKL